MASKIDIQLTFEGKTPLVTGNKYLTVTNLAQLLNAINHGSRYRSKGSHPVVKVTPTLVSASATATVLIALAGGATITISGQALTAQQSRARSTGTFVTAIAGNTLTVGGYTFVGTAGAVTLGDLTFSIDTGDTAAATSAAAQINAYVALQQTVVARNVLGVLTVCALAEGTSGNSITFSSTGGTITCTGSGFLANGAAIANNKFDVGSTVTLVAASLARAINASTTAAVQQVTATSALGVVTMTAAASGLAGNTLTLTSSDATNLAVTGSGKLTGGTQGATTTYNF